MKSICTLILAAFCGITSVQAKAIQKLYEVNHCWSEQKDIPSSIASPGSTSDETLWIQYHLQLVEQTLRQRQTGTLQAEQIANRSRCLNLLNEYWHTARFPVNDRYSFRTPIFIDRFDNFCAVGYLIKATGHEALSRKIAAENNLAYVRDMRHPELLAWADKHGFTVDELAWIQPTYPPVYAAKPVGKGTDGEVKELFVDHGADRLYVGGAFTTADSTITVNNIAYVTESNGSFIWHKMGNGVPGPVHAIAKHDNKVFAAGSFNNSGSNVAYWDGNAWRAAGCTGGIVNDLIEFSGELYAIGAFHICTGPDTVNFAYWDGTAWQSIPGLSGNVNTAHVSGATIILGGDFRYNGNQATTIRWSKSKGFQPISGSIQNEVLDFENVNDTVYASCRMTVDSTNLIFKLHNNSWVPLLPHHSGGEFQPANGTLSFNTMCVSEGLLAVGGSFYFSPMVGYYASNCISFDGLKRPAAGAWITVDSQINKIVTYKGYMIAGGKFTGGYGGQNPWSPARVQLGGIASRKSEATHVPAPAQVPKLSLHPNPITSGAVLRCSGVKEQSLFSIVDASGKTVHSGSLNAGNADVRLPQLAPGVYMLMLTGSRNATSSAQFVVK